MAITTTNSTSQAAAFSIGPFKVQILDFVANSGATSGTVTADNLSKISHIITGGGGALRQTSAATMSGNVATLAFTVPAETAASRTIDGVLYTAVANLGADGNSITIQEVDGTGDLPPVTKGNETVFVTGNAIVVHIDPTAVTGSAQSDVAAAVTASVAASALVTASSASSTVASVTAATALQNGVTGGARGTLLCIGK